MKLPFPRRFKAWLVATVSLTAVALVSIAPMMRPRAQYSTTYTFTDLGTLGSGTLSRARGINNCGVVVGESNSVPGGLLHPFIWKAGVMKDIAPTFSSGTAAAVNSFSYVAGDVEIVLPPPQGAFDRAFIWHDDNGDGNPDGSERCSLGVLPGDQYSNAFDINDANQIVGFSGADLSERSFLWEQGIMQVIAANNGITPLWAAGVNNAGHIVGVGNLASGDSHAWLRKGSSIIDLKTQGGNVSFAYDLNEAEYVVGVSRISGNSSQHAFIWHDDDSNGMTDFCEPLTPGCEMKDLGTLGGTNSAAYDINASGVVIGYSDISAGGAHAFVYDVIMRDLNSPGVVTNLPVGWVLERADAINDGGQIVGHGTIGGQTRAFLLTPTRFTPPACPSTLPTVNVSVSPSSVAENGIGSLTYTFTRSMVSASPLVVNFSTGGTAIANDYGISAVGNVTIAGCTPSATVTVTPTADTTDEPDETVILTVTPDANYTVGAQSAATGTITDDDSTPTIQINNVTAAEPNPGPTSFVFTVGLTNPSSSQVTVNYATALGTTNPATGGSSCGSGVDFVNASDTLTFSAGETSKQVSVQVCGDNDVEPDETFFVNLSGNSVNSNLPGNTKGTGTITNDDTIPTVSVAVAPLSTAEDGANLVYTFTRSSTGGSLTVNFSVGGTADLNTDYTQTGATAFAPPTGSVTFLNGSPTATVTVNPNADSTVESDETVILTLSTDANYTIGSPGAATGTITNDDTDVTVTVAPTSVTENGTPNLVYTFTRTGVTTGALTVNFSVGGTAGFSSDYGQTGAASFTASTGTVTFTAGNTQAMVTIDPTADTTDEPDETVILTITANAAYTVGSPGTATGTITNDDAPLVQLGQSTFTVIEDAGVATITVTRSGDTSSPATVKFSTSDMAGLQSCTIANTMASERCDYTTAVGRVTFAPAETSKTFTVPIVNDVWVEGNETFFVNLSSPVGASLGSQATSTVQINDDDFATPTSNPIFGVEYFIRAMYRDILNRQPDSQGLQNWIDTLTPCPNGGFGEPPTSNCDRLHVAAGFFQSDEYLNRGYWAFRFYMVSFNTRPTYAQFIPDLSEVGGPKSPAEEETAKVAYAEAFVQRPAFLANYSGLSGQALADALTQKTGLPPFTVTPGMTNGQILRAIAERQTSLDKFLTEGTVSILYFGFQRRDPDAVGYQNNVDTLNANPNNLRHMIFIFIYSTEYLNRFGPQ